MRNSDSDFPVCSASQIAVLRSLRGLKNILVSWEGDDFLVRLLQPGHALQQLTRLMGPADLLDVTERFARVLGSLPSLAELHVSMRCNNVRFLSQLQQLTDLDLFCTHVRVDSDELVAALSHCTRIRTLQLFQLELTGDHLATLLPRFPHLWELRLREFSALQSLRCFDSPILAACLGRLIIAGMAQCPPSELLHLLNLRSLQKVCTWGFSSRVSNAIKAQLAVPCARLPRLDESNID